MAGKVFFSVSMSLDGFVAPDSPEELMGQQWMELQQVQAEPTKRVTHLTYAVRPR